MPAGPSTLVISRPLADPGLKIGDDTISKTVFPGTPSNTILVIARAPRFDNVQFDENEFPARVNDHLVDAIPVAVQAAALVPPPRNVTVTSEPTISALDVDELVSAAVLKVVPGRLATVGVMATA